MVVYDCFTFFNEFDMLELRLEETYNHVDVVVLVESDRTFTNIPKPYYFEENKHRYSRFLDKIRHIKVTALGGTDPWANEYHQRSAIMQGCSDAADDDLIIVSDVDEIIRANVIDDMRNSSIALHALKMPCFYYKFNFMEATKHVYPWAMAGKGLLVKAIGAQNLRDLRFKFWGGGFVDPYASGNIVEHAGWHFSYVGDNDFVKQKLVSFSHASSYSAGFVEIFDVDKDIETNNVNRFPVRLDDYFPKTILNNIDKYRQYILTDAIEDTAYNISNKGMV